jgi:hypothetical protein
LIIKTGSDHVICRNCVGQAGNVQRISNHGFTPSLLKLTARQLGQFVLPAKPSGWWSRLRARKESRWQAGMARYLPRRVRLF